MSFPWYYESSTRANIGHQLTDVPQSMGPRDMTWNDVDAVKLLEACMCMTGDSAQGTSGEMNHDEVARRVYAAQEAEWMGQLASINSSDGDMASEECSA